MAPTQNWTCVCVCPVGKGRPEAPQGAAQQPLMGGSRRDSSVDETRHVGWRDPESGVTGKKRERPQVVSEGPARALETCGPPGLGSPLLGPPPPPPPFRH